MDIPSSSTVNHKYRHRNDKEEHLEKYHTSSSYAFAELGNQYCHCYIERRVYTPIHLVAKKQEEYKLLDDFFSQRRYFQPTFAVWSFYWDSDEYSDIICFDILFQVAKPITEKGVKLYIRPRDTLFDVVWDIDFIEDSCDFIHCILRKYKKCPDSVFWNLTGNGIRICNYDECSFIMSENYKNNDKYQVDYLELLRNEEWGQLFLW